jgi:erythromycin esterase-like protein
VLALIDGLRRHNASRERTQQVGFFGLDLYSLRASMGQVIAYLMQVDPEAARRARMRYACFDAFGDNPQSYGYATTFGLAADCESAVVEQLIELTRGQERYFHADGIASVDELFYAQQNARVVNNAEAYYRAMFQGRDESWNLRDTHMVDTLDELQEHLAQRLGRPARIVVWAHNSHIGDARATSWFERGQINVGQLVRERHGGAGETFALGFTTHDGTVAAASDWDDPVERKSVRPSRADSIERLLHDCGLPLFVLPLAGAGRVARALGGARLERAIGVIYRPDTELASHYFYATLPCQFAAVVHVDHSRAVRPLDAPYDWEPSGEPETYPSGV